VPCCGEAEDGHCVSVEPWAGGKCGARGGTDATHAQLWVWGHRLFPVNPLFPSAKWVRIPVVCMPTMRRLCCAFCVIVNPTPGDWGCPQRKVSRSQIKENPEPSGTQLLPPSLRWSPGFQSPPVKSQTIFCPLPFKSDLWGT
jgi:hypothetical protein